MKDAQKCVIIASRPLESGMLCYLQEGSAVFTADAGWCRAKQMGLQVDLAVGDFDSAPPPPEGFAKEVIRLSERKDDTDTHFAAKEALRRGFSEITLLGALGGRVDHSAAAMATLLHIEKSGARGLLAAKNTEIYCVMQGRELILPAQKGAYLSVFPAGGRAEGVTLRGVKYPLVEATLLPDVSLGVSNEFAGAQAGISCEAGALYAMVVFEEGRDTPEM